MARCRECGEPIPWAQNKCSRCGAPNPGFTSKDLITVAMFPVAAVLVLLGVVFAFLIGIMIYGWK